MFEEEEDREEGKDAYTEPSGVPSLTRRGGRYEKLLLLAVCPVRTLIGVVVMGEWWWWWWGSPKKIFFLFFLLLWFSAPFCRLCASSSSSSAGEERAGGEDAEEASGFCWAVRFRTSISHEEENVDEAAPNDDHVADALEDGNR